MRVTKSQPPFCAVHPQVGELTQHDPKQEVQERGSYWIELERLPVFALTPKLELHAQ